MKNAAAQAAARFCGWLRGRTVAEYLDSGRDNILLLRLIAALMVIFGHSYVLIANDNALREPVRRWLGLLNAHLIGVLIFFMVSGYLISLSWQRRPQPWSFLLARTLRIFPALIVCCVISAWVLGPAVSTLGIASYFTMPASYTYVLKNISLLQLQPTLPGVFSGNPVTDYVNGSLWTLPIEAAMYMLVIVLGMLSVLRRRWTANIAISCAIVFYVWPLLDAPSADFGRVLVAAFAGGALVCMNRDFVPVSTPLLGLLIVASALLHDTKFYPYILLASIAYATFWFAYVPRLPAVPGRGDFSYGVYLWGFPVQQTLLLLVSPLSPIMLFSLSAPISLLLGALSWRFVEQPALRLKQRSRQAMPP